MSLLRSTWRAAACARQSTRLLTSPVRHMSAASSMVSVKMDDKGVATLELNRKPVNSLSLELLTELGQTLDKLTEDRICKGIILTSANDGIFSAGLDILEMYQPSEARLRQFWLSLQELWLRLYGCPLPVVAAINGHSPAGGCLLAITADYRIMAGGKFTIGLNETKLGIVAPFWFKDSMINTIGHRQTEFALQIGHLYGADAALNVGLVDEVVPLDQVRDSARTQMDQWLQIPAAARQLTKMMMRQATIEKLRVKQQADIDAFVSFCLKDSVQKSLEMYLNALKKKKTT